MMVKAIVFMFVQCALLVLGNKWDANNDPSTWEWAFQYNLAKLPTSGQSSKAPWSDTYWPSYQGGIAFRWQDDERNNPGFEYKPYSLAELKNGSVDLNILSPAEKYDIFMARYDYPLLNSEWQRCHPDDAAWEGICHGWAPAAIYYGEPNSVTMKNKDGLEIPFASSDVKALLSYFWAQFASGHAKVQFLGDRCNANLDENAEMAENTECVDVNAGSFHVMLANIIGLGGKAFVADVDRSYEVWNQPVSKYEYTLGRTSAPTNISAPGTVKVQSVSLTMYYVKETYPAAKAHTPLILNNRYNYLLDLDADGNILGGSYDKNQWDRVDFIWSEDAPAFFGYFKSLDTLYKASVGGGQSTRMLSSRPHINLADYYATIVDSGRISLLSYNRRTRRSWFVPADADRSVQLHFTFFNTRRFTDFVRVFEVEEDGQVGAPIAVLHGSSQPSDIVLRPGVSALIAFSVDQKAARRMPHVEGTGFELFVL